MKYGPVPFLGRDFMHITTALKATAVAALVSVSTVFVLYTMQKTAAMRSRPSRTAHIVSNTGVNDGRRYKLQSRVKLMCSHARTPSDCNTRRWKQRHSNRPQQ